MDDPAFWRGRKVFITGHTGFKGAWLSLWLTSLGSVVRGYSLEPPTTPSLFEVLHLASDLSHEVADIRDRARLRQSLEAFAPEIVFHMAAQALVRESYLHPVETFETNVLGTVNLLDAVRSIPSVRAVVVVTTDKCYENREWVWGYREVEAMGGHDPYSSSKGCVELAVSAFRRSYFSMQGNHGEQNVGIASARAGNVIGGGDWAKDRLIPDIVRALMKGSPVMIRNPKAIRPWQHVLEPLAGYLLLARRLFENDRTYADAWNFGPYDEDAKTVEWVVARMCALVPGSKGYKIDGKPQPHEASYLKLDCSKARQILGWKPRWALEEALSRVVEWTLEYSKGTDMRRVSLEQIQSYSQD
ncbi:MAG: CDP-glucose 4,6-dehydratase [Spirochaetia bacterium]